MTPPTSRTGTRAPSSAARTCYSDTPTVPRAGAGVLAHLGVVPRRRPAHLGVVYGRMPIWDRWGFGTSERGGQRTSRCRGRWCTGIDPTSHYGVGYGFSSSRTPACRIDRRRLPHVQKRGECSLAAPRQKSRAMLHMTSFAKGPPHAVTLALRSFERALFATVSPGPYVLTKFNLDL